MSISYNDLIARAQQVRDESEVGANTATRVGQLIADIIQWCQDNNADLGDYLLNFTAHLNESGGILNWFQSRIVLLKTMGSAYDDVSVGSLSDGDVYYDSQGNWIREKQGSATINGIHPSKGVFYVNLANKTVYQWDGTTFQVEIESGGGGGASTVTAFEGYEVVASVADLPEQGDPVTGYIVGTHIYAYVGENGDTADGKYQDLGVLAAAGVSVTTNGDGTFTIHAGGNDYTVNLNHSHPNMCKLVVCEESDLPSTLDEDTIYGVNEDGEIAMLYVGGIPFYGGGGASSPVLRRPDGSSIPLGENFGSGVSKDINVKGMNLTEALTIGLSGTGLAFDSTQPSGVTRVSDTQLTVTAEAANALNGVDIKVNYSGTAYGDVGTLGITGGSNDNISRQCTLTATVYEALAGVKLTGTQWLQTDYRPNALTEFEFNVHLEANANTPSTSGTGIRLLQCANNAGDGKKFQMFTGRANEENSYGAYQINFVNESSILNGGSYQQLLFDNRVGTPAQFVVDPSKIKYTVGSSNGTISFNNTSMSAAQSVNTSLKTSTMESDMMIGYDGSAILNQFNLTIHSLVITENDVDVRHYVPKKRNGVAGLYDTVNNTFISSETATELVAIPLT